MTLLALILLIGVVVDDSIVVLENIFRHQKHIDKNNARSRLDIPIDKKIVTYTGGLYPDRDIENIIYLKPTIWHKTKTKGFGLFRDFYGF